MNAVHALLRRLRNWFLAWFIAEAVVGIAASAYVLDGMRLHPLLGDVMGGMGAVGTILSGVVVSLLLLWLAWVVLGALLDLKPWARVVMLVVGWITVASATLNLLALPGTSVLLEPVAMLIGSDWLGLVTVGVLTKVADLAFWSWVIYVLQMNAAVREAFACRS